MLPLALREERRARFMAVAEDGRRSRSWRAASARRCRCWSIRRRPGPQGRHRPQLRRRARDRRPRAAAAAGEGLEDAEGGRVHAREDRRRGRPRPGRRCRSDAAMATEPMKKRTRRQHLADRPPLPSAGRLRLGAAGGAQGVDGAVRRTPPRCAPATGRRRPATPTDCTARRRPSSSRSGSPRSRAACRRCSTPSGLAAITLVDTALLQSGDEVLLPDNVYGPSKELARNELARWGIAHASTTRWIGVAASRAVAARAASSGSSRPAR